MFVQGIHSISVQSSVSLQHLPYDKELEKNVEASIAGRLSFATQKLSEIVKAAKDAPTLKDDQIKAGLPDVGTLLDRACLHHGHICLQLRAHYPLYAKASSAALPNS